MARQRAQIAVGADPVFVSEHIVGQNRFAHELWMLTQKILGLLDAFLSFQRTYRKDEQSTFRHHVGGGGKKFASCLSAISDV